MGTDNIDNEDEDIIIQGTSLYEHLHKLGYMDFESVTICQSSVRKKETNSRFIGFLRCIKNIFKKIYVIYSRVIQEDNVSRKQVKAILNAKVLLHDHACTIHSFLDKYEHRSWRTLVFEFILFSAVLSSSIYTLDGSYKRMTSLLALVLTFCVGCIECSRAYAHKELKSVVSLQNDLFELCKKGLKILRYGYRIKLSKEKCPLQFYDLTADRLRYLQPMMENIIKCLKHASCAYYRVSLILKKLLPLNVFHESLLTKFEIESFELHGEINYKKLKHLYYTYMLTQSEMLHLLAIAYDSHTWRQHYSKIPELKLAYIVRSLIGCLKTYKNELSNVIAAYYSFKVDPTSCKYKGPVATQFQDLYMHMYLASNKLQLAYGHISSILDDIDNNVDETVPSEDFMENTMQRINEIQSNIDAAKGFVEFSNLFIVKARIHNHMDNHSKINILTSVTNSEAHMVQNDSEPEILDEVFEEYTKGEYLKPVSEEMDEISLYNYKRDKSLIKNFMVELKDALVDKKKSMSERESKALERMCKRAMKEHHLNDDDISTASAMSSFDTTALIEKEVATDRANHDQKSEQTEIVKPISECEENLTEEILSDSFDEQKCPIFMMSLPKMQLESKNKDTPLFFPTPFLKANEETFIGSGENSEDEIIETDSDK